MGAHAGHEPLLGAAGPDEPDDPDEPEEEDDDDVDAAGATLVTAPPGAGVTSVPAAGT
jgi:hypothetical protein